MSQAHLRTFVLFLWLHLTPSNASAPSNCNLIFFYWIIFFASAQLGNIECNNFNRSCCCCCSIRAWYQLPTPFFTWRKLPKQSLFKSLSTYEWDGKVTTVFVDQLEKYVLWILHQNTNIAFEINSHKEHLTGSHIWDEHFIDFLAKK